MGFFVPPKKTTHWVFFFLFNIPKTGVSTGAPTVLIRDWLKAVLLLGEVEEVGTFDWAPDAGTRPPFPPCSVAHVMKQHALKQLLAPPWPPAARWHLHTCCRTSGEQLMSQRCLRSTRDQRSSNRKRMCTHTHTHVSCPPLSIQIIIALKRASCRYWHGKKKKNTELKRQKYFS